MLSYFGLVPQDSLLDVPNAVLGIVYYSIILLLSSLPPPNNTNNNLNLMLQLLTCAAFASSVFLAYQLTFVIGDLCVLCWTTHVINTCLLYLNVLAPQKSADTAATATAKPQKKRV